MFTVCSKCNLRLTVTATDLRAAQGYVRCGRCHNVFNALAALADDPNRQGEAEGTAAATQSRPALTAPEPHHAESAVVDTAAQDVAAQDVAATDTSLEFNPASTNINEVFIEASPGERTGTFESIIISGGELDTIDAEDAAAAAAEPIIAPQALSAPATPVPTDHRVAVDVRRMRDALAELERIPAAVVADTAPEPEVISFDVLAEDLIGPAASADETPTAVSGHEVAAVAAQPVAMATAALLEPRRAGSRAPHWALRCAAVVLVLCLVAQMVHHYRGELAGTSALHRPLTLIYQALGQPLVPRWDIANYEIRQLGASTEGAAAGNLVVRASIGNRAKRDQPLPLLRVVMQDQFGNRVAARDLKPAEYLGPGAPPVSLMAPGQRVDVQVAFRDPGQAATGFEIDACMAGRNNSVTCANDPPNH